MKYLFFLFILFLFPFQDKSKDLPAEVVIPAEAMKELQAKAKDAETAGLRAENLKLRIDAAQVELKKLQEEAERTLDESNAAFKRAAIKAGIPGDKVTEYSGETQKDGALKLTRKKQ